MKRLALIAAVAKNDVIGVDGRIPWRLPYDMKFFKNMTTGHPIIMGRKTFESIGRALCGRINIVVTTNRQYKAFGCFVVHSLEDAIDFAARTSKNTPYVIGGESLYREAMPIATDMFITHVKMVVKGGDTFFPEITEEHWDSISISTDETCKYNYYRRRTDYEYQERREAHQSQKNSDKTKPEERKTDLPQSKESRHLRRRGKRFGHLRWGDSAIG